jgi:hypothetical protein
MATQFPTAPEALTAHSHEVAMPYRGDGVACALRATYRPDDDGIPPDMLRLLATIDEPVVAIDPGSAL